MQILKTTEHVKKFLSESSCEPGCLADTGFLYAASYMDDRLYDQALEIFDLLAEFQIQIFANVISRMEFVDLIFRKQVTVGAINLFNEMNPKSIHTNLFNLLKNIRDQDVAHKKKKLSYKISENRLKALREELEATAGPTKWINFCAMYSGEKLFNEWEILEQEFGLNFVEVLDGETSDIIERPLHWNDMVRTMGELGIRGPDAMITNLFLKSRLPLMITTDADIVRGFNVDNPEHAPKTILHLE